MSASVLGPKLFLAYVNDIGEDLEFSKIRFFFADDALYMQSDAHCFQNGWSTLKKWAKP